jgi:uncharacterized lipoprotein YddW (UPF0748 family)
MDWRWLSSVLTLLAVLHPAAAQSAEMRAVWIARDGLTSRTKIESTLDQLAAANVNCVCVNVWSRGYTIHPSAVMLATCGIEQDPSFVGRDPLREFVIEAHRRGIEVEAWFEYGFMACWSGWYPGTSGNGPVLDAHPNWAAMDQQGTIRVSDGNGGYFTWFAHENPQARRFLLDLTAEVVERYDVDGVQWDRIRYPSTAFGYDPATVAAYQATHNNQSPPTNVEQSNWKRWRADGLTAFAVDVYQTVKSRRSTVRVTNAPVPMSTSYNLYLQDWPDWMVAGALDLCYPQTYRTTLSSYTAILDQNLAAVRTQDRARIAPGIRAISGTPTAEVVAMVQATRSRGLPGVAFWYAEGLYDDLPSLQAQVFGQPAAVPGQPAGWRPTPVLAEDDDPTTSVQGSWQVAQSSAASDNGRALLALLSAPMGSTVRFQLNPPTAGLYDILTHQWTSLGRSANVPHRADHVAGQRAVWIDQRNSQLAGWHLLARAWLDPALGPFFVEVESVPGFSAAADAAMLLRSRMDSGVMATFGSPTTGNLGPPRISLTGNAAVGGGLELQVHKAPPATLCFAAVGFTAVPQPLFGGLLYVVPTQTMATLSDPRGSAEWTIGVPFDPALRGLPLWLQTAALDAGASGGVALSQAVSTVIQ